VLCGNTRQRVGLPDRPRRRAGFAPTNLLHLSAPLAPTGVALVRLYRSIDLKTLRTVDGFRRAVRVLLLRELLN
jgi:hypothetical protein